MNEDSVHIAEMAKSYMQPIREQPQNWLKHFKTLNWQLQV
jgi:hypothetical protein